MSRNETKNLLRMTRLARRDAPYDPSKRGRTTRTDTTGQTTTGDGKTHLWGENVDLKYIILLGMAGAAVTVAGFYLQVRSITLVGACLLLPAVYLLGAKLYMWSQYSADDLEQAGLNAMQKIACVKEKLVIDNPSNVFGKIWNGFYKFATFGPIEASLWVAGKVTGKPYDCPKAPKPQEPPKPQIGPDPNDPSKPYIGKASNTPPKPTEEDLTVYRDRNKDKDFGKPPKPPVIMR